MSKIISGFLATYFDKNDEGLAECPFCGHFMNRHKIVKDAADLLSLCAQCKTPCFGVASLQKRPANREMKIAPTEENRGGAPVFRQTFEAN
jgi:hypothetical protein